MTRSGFTLADPPPLEAPAGARVRTYWRGAAEWWRDHYPDRQAGRCEPCGHTAPCPTWLAADHLLADALGRGD